MLKGWNKHQNPWGPTQVGLSFNNNREEDGKTIVNDGTKSKCKFTRCVRPGHKTADCYANKSADGTVFHIMGDIEKIKDESEENNENDEDVSSTFSSDLNASYDIELEELLFIQPHIHSQGEKQSVCSKNLVLKTWILLDS